MRTQKGYTYRQGPSWFLRYNDDVMQPDGTIKRVQVLAKLAPFCDEYRNEKAVRPLAAKILAPINAGDVDPQSTMRIEDFILTTFLPEVKSTLRRSSYKNYNDIFRLHVQPRLAGKTLRKFRCCDAENILADVARQAKTKDGHPLSHSSLERVKAFLSGVFKTAKRKGAFDGVNPVQDCKVPKGTPARDTYAYSPEEIRAMLAAFDGQTRTVILLAAHTGLRKGEVEGLLWRNFDGHVLNVERSLWNGFTQQPKTTASAAPVPVTPQLRAALDLHRASLGSFASEGFPIFQSECRTPLNMANLAKRVIVPTLAKIPGAPKWNGWHAFRRGLATNLHAAHIDDKTIQCILRHSNVRVTQDSYIKTIPQSTVNALNDMGATMENVPCKDVATPNAELVN
jgi:integrase